MKFVVGCVRNLKIMVMNGLKNYAELYLMNSCFSHHHRNVTVTKFVSACMSVTLLLLSCMTDFWALSQKFGKQLLHLCFLSVGPLGITQLPPDGFS
jgi:hypothetical protein